MMPTWLRGTLVLALVFTGGVATGMFVEQGRQPADVAVMNPDNTVAALDRRVGLDSTQRATIRAALARHQAAVDSAWQRMRPGVAAAVDSLQMEIYGVLRPDQRPAFLEMLRRTHPGMPIDTKTRR
jgi:hypothetical protein